MGRRKLGECRIGKIRKNCVLLREEVFNKVKYSREGKESEVWLFSRNNSNFGEYLELGVRWGWVWAGVVLWKIFLGIVVVKGGNGLGKSRKKKEFREVYFFFLGKNIWIFLSVIGKELGERRGYRCLKSRSEGEIRG